MSKDTIYRQDAVSEIHKYFCEEINKTPHGTDEDGEDVYTDMPTVNSLLACNKQLSKRIKALPPAESRWIPIDERLPEKEGWYITTVESEKTGKRRIESDLFAVDIALEHGHTPNKFCKDGYRQKTVAWMPFPEPYNEVEE